MSYAENDSSYGELPTSSRNICMRGMLAVAVRRQTMEYSWDNKDRRSSHVTCFPQADGFAIANMTVDQWKLMLREEK